MNNNFFFDWFGAAAVNATNDSIGDSIGGASVAAAEQQGDIAVVGALAGAFVTALVAARAAAGDPFVLQCACAALYLAGVVACNAAGAYQDALIALREHRRKGLSSDSRDEWVAARKGAYADGHARFWRSLVWPATAGLNVVPNIVLMLNPLPPRRAAAVVEESAR
jgi:hypothetical protein